MITIPIAKLINTNNTAPIDPAVAKYAKIGEGVAHGDACNQVFPAETNEVNRSTLQR